MNLDFHHRNKCSSGRQPALAEKVRREPHTCAPGAPSFFSKLKTQNSKLRVSERGVALVITLILLSVTLVMAIAFLAISRRERGSVTTETDSTTAKLAADSALAQAEARIVSQILITTNPYVQPLLVSTNYYNSFGFDPGFDNGTPNPTNVNYNYRINNGGNLASPVDLEQNIANLYFNPRPPVYYSNDFRYYLDLNRNGFYDTNGVVTNLDNETPPRGLGTVSQEVGDPEWIGVLEHPDQPHGPNNQFIARYCFIAVPADTLDINAIHNQSLNAPNGNNNILAPPTGDAYRRSQGVGSWEINLAAFLADLNTNRWDPGLANFFGLPNEPYSYPGALVGGSVSFDDARSLIAWRYGFNYNWLASANTIFPNITVASFPANIDLYSARQQLTFNTNYLVLINPSLPWLGAPNTNDFFSTPSELFDPTRSSQQFVNNLATPGTYNSTYDRYTFYRMLAQMSSDSVPESGKINLNYSNAVVNYVTTANGDYFPSSFTLIPNAETNFTPWVPENFFNAAADKMLHAYSSEWFQENPTNYLETYYATVPRGYLNFSGIGVTNLQYFGQTNQIPVFGITNIPVYLNGRFVYTPAINRILQLAANIYDASTYTNNASVAGISNFPSVFRPVFWTTNELNSQGVRQTDVYIKGYDYVVQPLPVGGPPIFSPPMEVNTLPLGISSSNVWGVPWIIGAKKGFPNFNAFEWQSSVFIERELQFTRDKADPEPAGSTFPYTRIYQTNQMYIVGISNLFGSEDWNSYQAAFSNSVTIVAQDYLTMALTNNTTMPPIINQYIISSNVNLGSWPGSSSQYSPSKPYPLSFVMPFGTNKFLPESLSPGFVSTNNTYVYYYGTAGSINASGGIFGPGPTFIPVSMDPPNYPEKGTPPLPQFGLQATNRLQAYILDTRNGTRILDYVQLGNMDASLNINQVVADESYGSSQGLWSTNYFAGNIPYGVYEQFLVSEGNAFPTGVDSDEGAGSGNPSQGWSQAPVPGAGTDTSPAAQQAFFKAFFSPDNEAPYNGGAISNVQLSIQAPFTPMRLAVQRFIYQANDPLVHYLTSDLFDVSDNTNSRANMAEPPPTLNPPLGIPNDRYMPWGQLGNLKAFNSFQPDNNPYNIAYKDPLVLFSDSWDFPTNKFPSVGWLGRVHRGTPWQTVYLKSTNLLELENVTGSGAGGEVTSTGWGTWMPWTGNVFNGYDATNTAPVQDRLLFDLFTTTPNDDATRGRLSVNVGADQPFDPMVGLAAWSAVLSGNVVFSNNVNDNVLSGGFHPQAQDAISGYFSPGYSNLLVQPLGAPPYPNGNIINSAMLQLVQSINRSRTNYVGIDGLHGAYEHVGDVLSAPALSDGSPFLQELKNGVVDNVQLQHGISDEMYEWLPQQVMGLLTVNGTPQAPQRYVVYCYGQTLKPAPNSIVASGSTFFGLVTNYQVTAEIGSRVIIRVDNAPTPANPTATPHIVVEQYNPLPPD